MKYLSTLLCRVPGSLINYWNKKIVRNANPLPGSRNSQRPSARISEALGSKVNPHKFVILVQTVNYFKAVVSSISVKVVLADNQKLWAYKDPVDRQNGQIHQRYKCV